MKRIHYISQFLRIALLFTVSLTLGLWAVGQEPARYAQPTVNLDSVTKIFAIASTILGLCVGALQLYIANKIAKVKEEFNAAVIRVKEEFSDALHKETEILQQKFESHLEKVQNRVATKDDIGNIREFVKMSMEKIELQIKLSSQQNRLSS